METADGFSPIIAIFYSVFHPTEGTKVIHQVPSGVIVPPSHDDNLINNNLPDSSAFSEPLFDFDTIKNYVIPKPSLCNKLITLKIDKYRISGFPVNIYAPHYARNSFGFNLCFVFSYDSDTTPYEGNIKRIGKMFRALEEQSQLLSKCLKDSHVYYQQSNSSSNLQHLNQIGKFNMNNKYLKVVDDWDDASQQIVLEKVMPGLDSNSQLQLKSIESLIQQIYQDLNNYSECMIPIDASNSVDLKLFPISPPPPHIHSYDVPIAILKLDSLIDSLWDPTMLKIVPFINGINSVYKISVLSNADLNLTKECIRHLLHYNAITILDIFQFSNHYMVTSSIGNFLRDPNMAKSCQDYVMSINGSFGGLPLETKGLHRNSASYVSINSKSENANTISASFSSTKQPRKPQLQTMDSVSSNPFNQKKQQPSVISLPSKATLFQLYNSLNSHFSVKQWYKDNAVSLEYIDVRKFITFGVRAGIIARVHSYPVSGKLSSLNVSDAIDLERREYNKNEFNASALPILSKSKADLLKPGLKNIDPTSEFTDCESETSTDDDEQDQEEGDVGRLDSDHDQFEDVLAEKRRRKEIKQEKTLLRLIRHNQHLDSICTTMELPNTEVFKILDRIGDIEIIDR